MSKDQDFSIEQLNAYIDDELDSEERSQLFKASVQSSEFANHLCQLRNVNELVNIAYKDIPEQKQEHRQSFNKQFSLRQALVASVLILIGLGAGIISNQSFLQGSSNKPAAIVDAVQTENYILHVANGDQQQMLAVLRKARQLLEQAEGKQPNIEIVANEHGLNLLRSDITPYAEEISALADKNIAFYACARAIERLEEKGVNVQLVPEANTRYTALDRVVLRMQEGWKYLKI